MSGRPRSFLPVVAALSIAVATSVWALPHPDEPIDTSKRAPVSTKDAVRPSAMSSAGDGVVGKGRLPISRANIQTVATTQKRAPIALREERSKETSKPTGREMLVRRGLKSRRAAALPASVPRIDGARFQKILEEYRTGGKPPGSLANLDVRIDPERADIADINRYASPRATLEAQGIPVTSAGSKGASNTENPTIPFSQENAGQK